jgi:hypothetical protein
MAEQFKEMSPADVREQKMRDNMGKAADKAKENSLGAKTDKSMMQKALEWIDPTLKNGPINQSERDVQDAKKITAPVDKKKGGSVKAKPKCMARGGGIEVRGKTRGRFV